MKLHGLVTAMALTLAACGPTGQTGGPGAGQAEEQAELGTLSLNLVGADSDGRQYRLREADFSIFSYYYDRPPFPFPSDGGVTYFETTVSSEDDLSAARITLRLVPGQYNVSLLSPGWYLERNVEGTWQRVEEAVLLTPANQYAYVYNDSVANLNFRFGVDGQLIDFRSGELSIGIEIEQPGEGAPDAGGFIGGLLGGFGGIAGGPIPVFDAGVGAPLAQ